LPGGWVAGLPGFKSVVYPDALQAKSHYSYRTNPAHFNFRATGKKQACRPQKNQMAMFHNNNFQKGQTIQILPSSACRPTGHSATNGSSSRIAAFMPSDRSNAAPPLLNNQPAPEPDLSALQA